MPAAIHFISGLPRAGSTLLAALLRQNPRFRAGMTGPAGALFTALLRETSARSETGVFVDEEMRIRLLRGMFDAVHHETPADGIAFDTNRLWTTKLPALSRLFPQARVICCVRNPAWVLDSFERLIRRNAFDVSGIFNFDPGGTVYTRAEGLASATGMLGFAWQALREAAFGPQADRLLLVRYESLAANPMGTLAAIYGFLGEPFFPHDPDRIEPTWDMVEFDMRMGTPGLHEVGRAVRPPARATILPPDLFARHERDAFWEDLSQLPKAVRIV